MEQKFFCDSGVALVINVYKS